MCSRKTQAGRCGAEGLLRVVLSNLSMGRASFVSWLAYLHVLIFNPSQMDAFVKYNTYKKLNSFLL